MCSLMEITMLKKLKGYSNHLVLPLHKVESLVVPLQQQAVMLSLIRLVVVFIIF